MNSLSGHGARWTYEEHVIAFNLYCQIPFGKLHHRNQRIIELASLLGRTPSSVAMKLSNFARLDPSLKARGIGGLPGGAAGEETVWDEFIAHPEALAFKSEQLLAARIGQTVEETAKIEQEDLPPAGVERDAIVRVRVNQSFFRRRIISAFDGRCCVTGMAMPQLLVASHIIPWSRDSKNRLNPRNGLCLNALHDKAFDRGLMWVEEDFLIRFSERVRKATKKDGEAAAWVTSFEGKPLHLPKGFTPDPELLRLHRDGITHEL